MNKKLNVTNIAKIAGWIAVAIGGFVASVASDKEQERQNEENFKKYISEKENGES